MDREISSILMVIAPILLAIIWRIATKASDNPRNLPYPPGPKPLPFVGNLYDTPKAPLWRGYSLLSRNFGDVLFLKIFGQPILILGSAQATTDLLDRRSAIYSDRPETPMLSLIGWDWSFASMSYGQYWRAHRREFQEHFRKSVLGNYTATMEQQTLTFLRVLLDQPENVFDLVRLWFGGTLFKIMYDIDVNDLSNEYLQLAEKALESIGEAMIVGCYWVDLLPILKYIPMWMPGAGFKRKAAKWRVSVMSSRDAPFQVARSAWSEGKTPECIVQKMLANLSEHPDQVHEDILRNVAAIGYIAGSDTSVSTARSFLLAMAMYPDIQKKAQEALNDVVGPNKLPRVTDRESLPYVEAIVREALRWQPALPLGLPHKCMENDEYRGYFIPKGTMILTNQWAILHDPDTYPDPEEFNPDRYIKDGKLDLLAADPRNAAFGFGRRICPGQFFAEDSVFLFVASVLHLFDISAPLDDHGMPVRLEPRMTNDGVSHPEPFKCVIKPHSSARAVLFSG